MKLLFNLLVSVIVLSSAQLCYAQAIQRGVDMPGGDYTSFDMSGGPRECLAACAKDQTCQSWTYVRAGVQGDSPRCWLKASVVPSVQDDCCSSGAIN